MGSCYSIDISFQLYKLTSLVAQTVKHLPTMRETRVQSLGPEGLLEKGMATHSSILAPYPQKKGLKEIFLRRKWQPTSVFLPGESQGQGSVVGCHLWGRTELDTTEAT